MRDRRVEAAGNAVRGVQEEWNANQGRQRELVDEVRAAELESFHRPLPSRDREGAVNKCTENALAVRLGPVDPADLVALDRFRAAAQRRLLRMTQEAEAIAARLAESRAALQTAERDKKLLVRLREKSLLQWRLEYDKEQRQLAEEAYLSRWNAR